MFSIEVRRGLQRQIFSRQKLAQCYIAQSLVFREYLRENEFFTETILDCLSGTQMGSIHEIKICKKIS